MDERIAERGKAVARRVRTGTIGINRYLVDPGAPFGGIKASGIGRELGPDAPERLPVGQNDLFLITPR